MEKSLKKRVKTYNLISLAAMEELLKRSGAEKVSLEAKREFSKKLEELGLKLASKITALCKHTGRKVVKKRDVVEALEL